MDNCDYTRLSRKELESICRDLEARYGAFLARKLKLNMARGRPGADQLDLSDAILTAENPKIAADGMDCRNYGCLEGLPEMRVFFGELLGLDPANIIIGGNSSLNLMYDCIMRLMVFGTQGHTPWGKLPKVKFLCPVPGYDRHFAVTQAFGIEMVNVPMTSAGPDMEMVEKLAASDESVKGIWCVPLYSNPQGVCYSERTAERLASMKAAPDFRIFWDNAYGVHHIYSEGKAPDIFAACTRAGNPDRAFYFFSTSKITFPGAGVALMASSEKNVAEIKKHLGIQTIGPDKLNQLRTVRFLKDADGVRAHMRRMAAELKPKFDVVLSTLERELGGTGLAEWTRPEGGYFVAVDTLDNCAKATVDLAKKAGVTLTGAGAAFPYHRDPRDRNIRLAPTYPTLEDLTLAIRLFCVCVKLAGVSRLIAEKE